jgi:hypothetical protein
MSAIPSGKAVIPADAHTFPYVVTTKTAGRFLTPSASLGVVPPSDPEACFQHDSERFFANRLRLVTHGSLALSVLGHDSWYEREFR